MAERCILHDRWCNGCGECEEPEDAEENEGLTAQQIHDAKEEEKLIEKGLI